MKYKATILGAQGYTGRELARLLLAHPQVELAQVFSRNPDWRLNHDLPESSSVAVSHVVMPEALSELPALCKESDIIFLATPHEVSLECIPYLYDQKKWIIDLSGAFRLPAALFEKGYQQEHGAKEFLSKAQYGLCPWQTQAAEKLISNPGCYATASLMALLPLAKEGLLKDKNIIIDAKSGVSGAGRSAKTDLLFGEIQNNFFPYKIGTHQHIPEIEHTLSQMGNTATQITLNTQVLPIQRGISVAIYVPLNNNEKNSEAIKKAYEQAYQNYLLVRQSYLADLNNKEQKVLLSLKSVVGSCRTHIIYQIVNNHLVVFSMIDNLLKGAASQAIENMNRALGLSLTTSLENYQGTL